MLVQVSFGGSWAESQLPPRLRSVFLALLLLLHVRDNNHTTVVNGQAFNEVDGQAFNEEKYEEFVAKMERDVIELASAVQDAYETRCDADSTIAECGNANYADCLSLFPHQECRGGVEYSSPDCKNGGDKNSTTLCSSFFDFSISSIRLPWPLTNGDDYWNPRDQSVKEAICFSRRLDPWFIEKRRNDTEAWKSLLGSTEPPLNSMFFASQHGPFRIYPARQSRDCGLYDARVRPWYIAASSGPKNVVLLLDISGDMDDGDRLQRLKHAAQSLVNATTVLDSIAVVTFSSNARAYPDGGYMVEASDESKRMLNDAINNLTAFGGTNYFEAFDTAFNVLNATIANQKNTKCNTAVILITDDGDGNQQLGKNLTVVKSLVTTRMKEVSAAIEKPAVLLTYILSSSSSNSNAALDAKVFTSELACEVEYGAWTQVFDDQDLTDALLNYYRLFALGLRPPQDQDEIEPFVAWVKPYSFATSSNTNGTTVSRPVYDRSSGIFLGVVGINFALSALDAALSNGITATSNEMISQEVIKRIGRLSQNKVPCPRVLNLTACKLDAYQAVSHSSHRLDDSDRNQSKSFCDRGCTDPSSVRVQETVCVVDEGFYPNDLWNNTHFLLRPDTSYKDRFCCKNITGLNAEDDVCLAATVPTGAPTGAPKSVDEMANGNNAATVPTGAPTGAPKSVDEMANGNNAATVPTGAPTGAPKSVDEMANGNNNGDKGLNKGAIAGITLSLVALMAGLILFGWKRGAFTRGNRGGESSPTITPPPPTNPSYAMWETSAPTAP